MTFSDMLKLWVLIHQKIPILFFIFFTFSLPALTQDKPAPGLNEATLKGLAWRSIGPAMTAGRIADIAVSHEDRRTAAARKFRDEARGFFLAYFKQIAQVFPKAWVGRKYCLRRGTALRAALMDAVRPHVEWRLGAPVQFVVRDLRVAGDVGFASLWPQRPGGAQIDLYQTPGYARGDLIVDPQANGASDCRHRTRQLRPLVYSGSQPGHGGCLQWPDGEHTCPNCLSR